MSDQPGCPCSICEDDSLRDRIAAALEKHCPDQYEQDMGECPCGFKYKAISEHCRHQADAVIPELERSGLLPQWHCVMPGDPAFGSPWIAVPLTEWKADDE